MVRATNSCIARYPIGLVSSHPGAPFSKAWTRMPNISPSLILPSVARIPRNRSGKKERPQRVAHFLGLKSEYSKSSSDSSSQSQNAASRYPPKQVSQFPSVPTCL
jgi:hypothetical protein